MCRLRVYRKYTYTRRLKYFFVSFELFTKIIHHENLIYVPVVYNVFQSYSHLNDWPLKIEAARTSLFFVIKVNETLWSFSSFAEIWGSTRRDFFLFLFSYNVFIIICFSKLSKSRKERANGLCFNALEVYDTKADLQEGKRVCGLRMREKIMPRICDKPVYVFAWKTLPRSIRHILHANFQHQILFYLF